MTDQEQLDHTPLTFGKHKSLTPSQIADKDQSYIVWLYEDRGPHNKPCSEALYRACLQDLADDAHSPPGDPGYDLGNSDYEFS